MHQQTNKLAKQIWTETITLHWWSPVISCSIPLIQISHDKQRAEHQLRTFVTGLVPIFSFNMTDDVAMSISEAFFCSYKQVQLEKGTLLQLTNSSTFDQLVKRCSCSASLRHSDSGELLPLWVTLAGGKRPQKRPKRSCIWSLMMLLRQNGRSNTSRPKKVFAMTVKRLSSFPYQTERYNCTPFSNQDKLNYLINSSENTLIQTLHKQH